MQNIQKFSCGFGFQYLIVRTLSILPQNLMNYGLRGILGSTSAEIF